MKRIHADELTEIIGSKAVIGLGNACGEPQTLISALIEGRDAIEHIEIYGMIHFWTDQILKKNLKEIGHMEFHRISPRPWRKMPKS